MIDFCSNNGVKGIISIVGIVFSILRFIIPLVIIVYGTFDIYKFVVSNKEDDLKKNVKRLIYRIIAGLLIFFLYPIITFIFTIVDIDTNNGCYNCFIHPRNKSLCSFNSNTNTTTPRNSISVDDVTQFICSDSNDKNNCCRDTFGETDSYGIWVYDEDIGCKNTTPSIIN